MNNFGRDIVAPVGVFAALDVVMMILKTPLVVQSDTFRNEILHELICGLISLLIMLASAPFGKKKEKKKKLCVPRNSMKLYFVCDQV